MARAKEVTDLSKPEIITEFRLNETDTGSPEIQVALLTKRIVQLTQHLQKHKGDDHSRRGLLGMVGQRRRLFEFIERREDKDYLNKLKTRLGL